MIKCRLKMTKLKKSLHRRIHDACNNMRRRKQLIIVAVCVFLWKLMNNSSGNFSYPHSTCEPIDVVYTWVNGSDPDFIASVRQYDLDYDVTRFDDKQELRYSLRSLELHAPWVRHVYIVTNGQIPHWLDLSYERVTLVPHALLASNESVLPTFSSAAIETMIHKIPGLSKRFLYMNDDIFLGAPLYPEDLYTESSGVHVLNAWTVPDCAVDCPWIYIGDGACDIHCNLAECQYDGGDCDSVELHSSEKPEINETPNQMKHVNLRAKGMSSQNAFSVTEKPPLPKSSFKEMVRRENLSTQQELHRFARKHNRRLQRTLTLFQTTPTTIAGAPHQLNINLSTASTYKVTKDIYSQSLIYTNMLLNRHYGFKGRNVPAHVGFLLDRDVVIEMQSKFRFEFEATASHRFRAADDLQYAFIYYSYLTSETFNASVAQIFDEFDTDNSLTWSDREVRTFLARMYPLPLDWSAVHYFEEVIWNCSRSQGSTDGSSSEVVYSTLVYERYEDSNVPRITRGLVERCDLLADALMANFATRPKHKFSVSNSAVKLGLYSNFMMLTSNVTDVVDALDRMRQKPKKFNCINDNLEPQYHVDNELIRHLLEDFYVSFFPRRSKFELHELYRNRFTSWNEFQVWRQRKTFALIVGYSASACLILFLFKFACLHKAKFVRSCVQNL